MQQLELFDGLQPVKKWLHVWTDAERERNKVVHAAACEAGNSRSYSRSIAKALDSRGSLPAAILEIVP